MKYYICESCGHLTTEKEQLELAENSGGNGLCDCEFTTPFWNKKFDDLDVQTDRIYKQFTEINERWYNELKKQSNEVLRLRMFRCIPKEKLVEVES